MASIALLVDFGSTYTKLVAVDLDTPAILCSTQSPSTADTDVTVGLERAIALVRNKCRFIEADVTCRLSCSSARGGLRMVAVGLVRDLTTAVARDAALGAGAKVIEVFSHKLTRSDVVRIESLRPDVVLLAGGTDGGNRDVIAHNARALAQGSISAPVIMAGNRAAQDQVYELLDRARMRCYLTENVLPELDRLNVEPARESIRSVFIRHIVEAKGLGRATRMVDDVIMPTPAAVLDAATLLSQGTQDEPGFGDLMVVDVGGATTDVHSVSFSSAGRDVVQRGLPESSTKRTVEGDLGVRVNAPSVVELANGYDVRADIAQGLRSAAAYRRAEFLARNTEALSSTPEEVRQDVLMGAACVDMAVERHVGHVKEAYGLKGPIRLLYGKDLRDVNTLIGVGGVFSFGPEPWEVLRAGLEREELPHSMRPRSPALFCDVHYLFYAMGLLASRHRTIALRLLKGALKAQP